MIKSKKDVKKVLLKKGFTLVGGDHEYFFVYRNGQKTAVNTKISRGSGRDISSGLLKQMMKQIRLEREDFERYLNCTMSKDEYIQYLLDNKHIDC